MRYSDSLPLLLKGKGFKKIIEKRTKTDNYDVYSQNGVEVTVCHKNKEVDIHLEDTDGLGKRIKSMDKLMLLVEALEPVKQSINNEEGD